MRDWKEVTTHFHRSRALDAKWANETRKSSNTKRSKEVIKVALAAKYFFMENGLTSFVKLSGKTGIHLLLPCKAISYDPTSMIAQNLSGYVSAPLCWDEVNTQLEGNDFKMDMIKQRLNKVGDIFENLLDEKIQKSNTRILNQFLLPVLSK